MSIGKNIQTLRKQNNMSQDQLAQKCNVSRQTISRWECDEVLPDTNNLITLSKLFNKSLDEIVFDKQPEIKENKTKKHFKPLLTIVLILSLVINLFTLFNYISTKKNTLVGTWAYQEDGYDITFIIKEVETINNKPIYSPITPTKPIKQTTTYSIEVYKNFLDRNTNIKSEYDSKLMVHHNQDDKEIGVKYKMTTISNEEIYYDQKTNTLIYKCNPFIGKAEFKLEKIK